MNSSPAPSEHPSPKPDGAVSDIPREQPPHQEQRITALLEVIFCSGVPTQAAMALVLSTLGLGPSGGLQIAYVAPLLLADTAVLIGLILLFLRIHRERPGDVFLGNAPWRGELRAAVPMAFKAYGIAIGVLLVIAAVAPGLHNVEQNPLQKLLGNPRDAAVFAALVVVAGGVREELQRAFILHRFEGYLGGARVGLVLSSVGFGAGHLVQGADAAIATGLLGAFWGVSYVRRRSVIAPVVSHAAFDLLQIGMFLTTGR
ncbi:MAG: CPBP family intramembrane metalloprotease [Acidimicrobiia bacterium]|nr:CPBP family intramembrane metalloprotease [Acidimicrobiia bacterium]